MTLTCATSGYLEPVPNGEMAVKSRPDGAAAQLKRGKIAPAARRTPVMMSFRGPLAGG